MKTSTFVLILGAAVLLTNCSQQEALKAPTATSLNLNVQAQALVADASVFHSMSSGSHRLQLNSTVNAFLSSTLQTIENPADGTNFGSLLVQPLNNGQSSVNLDLDLSTLFSNPPQETSVTVDGVQISNVMSLPIGTSGSTVFFSVLHDLLGISMVLPQISSTTGAINTLLPLILNTSQTGTALAGFSGLFTGSNKQKVVSIFSDITPILDSVLGLTATNQTSAPPQQPTVVSEVTDIAAGVAGGFVTVSTGSPFLGQLANRLVQTVVNGLVRLIEHH